MNFLRLHLRALRRALTQFLNSLGGHFLCVFSIAIALTLPALGFLWIESAHSLGNKMALHEISLFLDWDISKEGIEKTRQNLEELSVRFQFVEKEKAFQNLSQTLGLGEMKSLMEENPLPDAFIVQPVDQSIENLKKLKEEFSTWENVALVQWDSAWAERFNALMDLARSLINLLALLFFLGLIAIVFNSARLQMLLYRDEMEVSWMMGATRHFIALPFYYFGALLGFLGAMLAFLLLYGLTLYLSPWVTGLATFYNLPLELLPPSWEIFAVLSGGAVLLSLVAVYFSARVFLRPFQ